MKRRKDAYLFSYESKLEYEYRVYYNLSKKLSMWTKVVLIISIPV